VNADDFGMDARLNTGIAECFFSGIVTSVSLVADGAAFQSAVQLLKMAPHVSCGVHLRLPPGQSLPRSFEAKHLECSLDAQIRKVFDAGIRPSHLDGHQYVHLLPPVFAALLKLAGKYRIRWVRYPRLRRPFFFSPRNSVKMFVFAACGWGQRRMLKASGIRFADHCFGALDSGRLDESMAAAYLRTMGQGVADLTCHPGYRPADASLQRWNYGWETEMAALKSSRLRSLIGEQGIKLVNYAER
jgi:chitin disaccharide deacetylase